MAEDAAGEVEEVEEEDYVFYMRREGIDISFKRFLGR